MRILYITTIGGTMCFFTSLVKELIEQGDTVDIVTNECNGESNVPDCYRDWGCKVYSIETSRSPLNPGNLRAIKAIKRIAKDGNYNIVHCHTPIAAACTRIACRGLCKKGLKVFYTAHGFHFYTGAPLKNWLIYYPVEWLCSFWTDTLITINKEDYVRAIKRFHAKKSVYVPGVGIDTSKFKEHYYGSKIREEFGIEGFMLLSVGELNDNKNHETVIRAIEGLPILYVIVGAGEKEEELRNLAANIGAKVIMAGYRYDVADFYDAADAYILPSLREGLNVSLMEAMASSLPCLCGKIRGNTDLIDSDGGFTFAPNDASDVRAVIQKLLDTSEDCRSEMGVRNRNKIMSFDFSVVNEETENLYRGELDAE